MIVKQINHMTDSETDFEVSNPQQFEEVFGEPLENRNLYEATLLLCEQRSNHHLDYTVSGDLSAQQPDPLSKSTGLPRFPGMLGQDFRPETDISSSNTARQRRIFALKTLQSIKDRPQYDYKGEARQIEHNIEPISQTVVPDHVKQESPVPPEYTRIQGFAYQTPEGIPTATIVNEGLSPTSRIREHESIHHTLNNIQLQYGEKIHDRVQDHLVHLIHPHTANILTRYLETNSAYRPNEYHHELLSHLFEMLNDPVKRKHMLDMAQVPEAERNEAMGFAKRSWKRILRTSQLFTPESLRIPKKS